MARLYLEVVTPEKVMASQEVDMVMAPGTEGEFGILPEHINFLSGIVPGELRFDDGDKKEYMAVTSGFAEVSNNRVSVLVDSAERAPDIDIERAQRAMERAKGIG
jgi:F-type H+-transporting ATPase subunit epsilon